MMEMSLIESENFIHVNIDRNKKYASCFDSTVPMLDGTLNHDIQDENKT